jgi:hypothetical protein
MTMPRAALNAEPEGKQPTEQDLYDLAAEFDGDPVPAMRRVLELWGNPLQGAPATGENPATPPAPETPAEALAARPLLEKVAQMGATLLTGGELIEVWQVTEQAAAWLRSNPPGQPVAIEPRGCPTPGACSCVEPTPPASEPGEVGELVEFLTPTREQAGAISLDAFLKLRRAATLLLEQESKLAALVQQLAEPAKALVVPVNEQPWNRPGWCDAEGRCWFCNSYSMGRWNYYTPPDPAQDWVRLGTVTHSAPHWAIPRPGKMPELPSLSVYSYDAGESVRISRMGESNCWCIIASGLIPDWWFNLEMHYDFASAGAAFAAIRLAQQDDIAQETLDDIGLPPAPQCLIARMANELDRLQPLPAFPPDTSHPLAIESHALLRGGTTTIPAPQAGEVEA